MPKEKIRTTLDIPRELLTKIDKALQSHLAPSRNSLLLKALTEYLERWEQKQIDQEIAQMASDPKYQQLQNQMVQEYEPSGWESLQIG